MTAENFERLYYFVAFVSGQLRATFGVGIPDLSWSTWIAIAAGCWLLQIMMTLRTREDSVWGWLIRLTFIAGTVCSTLIGMSGGFKWTWQ